MRDAATRPRFALARRAGSQAMLVGSLWAVVAACAFLAGFAAAISSAGSSQALSAAVAKIDATGADRVTMTAVATEPGIGDPLEAASAIRSASTAMTEAAGKYPATISVWASGRLQPIQGEVRRRGYLLDADTASEHARLAKGRWPEIRTDGTIEAAIPQTVAAALKLDVGDSVTLGDEERLDDTPAVQTTLTIVGVFSPTADGEWARDAFGGLGTEDTGSRLPEFGPFLVPTGTLTATDTAIDRLSMTMDPHPGSDASGIGGLTARIGSMRESLSDAYGDSVRWVVVRSNLQSQFGATVAHVQLSTSLAVSVLTVLVAIALAAVSLMGGLVARRRSAETAALRDRGAATAQLGARAGAEALALAAFAVALAAPLAWLVYRAVATSGVFGPAWSAGATPAPLPAEVWVASAAAALAAAALLVLAALARPSATAARPRGGALARSGTDVALAAAAAIGLVQLHNHTPAGGRVDPLLVVVPALCVLAVAALASRLLPLAATAAEKIARDAKGVALPLAGWHVARGGAMRGTFLAVAAAATAVLGTSFMATWSQSQADQADAAVGADVVVASGGSPAGVAALEDMAGGEFVPVIDRAVVLGTRPDGVALLALDPAAGASILRGRAPNGTWADTLTAVGPAPAEAALTVPGATISLTINGALRDEGAAGRPPVSLTATPTIVAESASGDIAVFEGSEVPLDGADHTSLASPQTSDVGEQDWHVLAVKLDFAQHETGDIFAWVRERADVDLTLAIDGAVGSAAQVSAVGDDDYPQLTPGSVAVADGVFTAPFSYAMYGTTAVDAHMTLLPIELPQHVSVLVSQDLATSAGLVPGDIIKVSTNLEPISAIVVGTVPFVPGHPHREALLADREAVVRALLAAGADETGTDAWWGGNVDASGITELQESGLGDTRSRADAADELRADPAQVPLRLAWVLAIASAVVLAVVGAAAHSAAESQRRATTTARLRAIGVSRRDALRSHLAQHAITLGAAILAGALAGVVLAWLMAPALIVSPEGGRPVPDSLLVLPWGTLALVVGLMLALTLAVGVPAARASVARSTVEALRAGEVA